MTVLRVVHSALVEAVGEVRTRSIADRTVDRMRGQGGSERKWLEALAVVIAEDGDEAAMAALEKATA